MNLYSFRFFNLPPVISEFVLPIVKSFKNLAVSSMDLFLELDFQQFPPAELLDKNSFLFQKLILSFL